MAAAAAAVRAYGDSPTELVSEHKVKAERTSSDATTLVVGRSAPELLENIDPARLVEEVFQRLHFEPPGQIRFMRDKEARGLSDIAAAHPRPPPPPRTGG